MSGFFTEHAIREQKFLKENYPKLWLKYDEYTGYMCITDDEFKGSSLIRQEIHEIISKSVDDSRYVMYRDYIPKSDGSGEVEMGYVICQANIVE